MKIIRVNKQEIESMLASLAHERDKIQSKIIEVRSIQGIDVDLYKVPLMPRQIELNAERCIKVGANSEAITLTEKLNRISRLMYYLQQAYLAD